MATVLYTVNEASQSVASGGTIDLGRTAHRNCQSQAFLNGDAITLTGSGYFEAEATVTFTGSAGLAAISLLNDGTAIPGASASATIGTADTETHTLSFACEVLKTPCRPRISLSLASTGVAITVTNVAVRVKRDA